MQSVPAVSSPQPASFSGNAASANPCATDGPAFAQVLGEQSSRSTPLASGATDVAAQAGTSPASAHSTASSSATSASDASVKKTSASATHPGDSSTSSSPTHATSTQPLPGTAAEPAAALILANASNPTQSPETATDSGAKIEGMAASVTSPSLAMPGVKATGAGNLASVAASAAQSGDDESVPMTSALAKGEDEGDGEITGLNQDSSRGAAEGASAILHAAAAFSSSLEKAKAYQGSGSSDQAKDDNDSSAPSLHLGQIGSTVSLSSSVTPAASPGSVGPSSSVSNQVVSANVPYQVGSDAWRADVSSHVLYFTQQNLSGAQLHLNPAHLGPLEVTIKSDNNQTTLAFSAAHEATRQAMQDSLPQLKQLFAAQGVALGNTTVSDQSQGSGNAQQERSSSSQGQDSPSTSAVTPVVIGPIALRSLSVIDTFA